MKSYFIIGTDTDCGKTYVTSALIDDLKAQQKTVMALKPVASGCERIGDHWMSGDAMRLQASLGDDTINICPWRFPLPISPHLAAEASGVALDLASIASFCQDEAWNAYDYLLIEGAGGLLVPLNDQETWIDVLKLTQIPVILVVGMRLGCINHALLTITALDHHGIQCAGWIANCLDNNMLYLEQNIQTLRAKIPYPMLARVEQGGSLRWSMLLK